MDYLTITKDRRQFIKANDIRATDVLGFAWVPGKPHTLIWANDGLYGSAGLRAWTPERGIRDLVGHVDSEYDAFKLDEIRRRGAKV
ncbi:MAG TPA: hypothetical protein VGL56_12360 [Fimbriimonadaceae bacterium]